MCIKRVPAPGARINVTADGQAVDTTNLGFTMSPHEECALEAGLQLVEAHGGTVSVASQSGHGSVFTVSLNREP